MAIVQLVLTLLAGETHLLRVDHDDEVARVNMGRVNRFMFSPQNVGYLRSQSTQGFPSASTTYHVRETSRGLAM